MVDEIFEMIMKEARSRRGKDLVSKINTVCMEVTAKIFKAMESIREEQRRDKKDEG